MSSFNHRLAWVLTPATVLACASLAPAAAPVFNAGASSVTFTHDPDGGGPVSPSVTGPVAIQNTASPIINYTDIRDLTTGALLGVSTPHSSTAKFGMGHSETANKATIVFAANSGLDQRDDHLPSPTPASTLQVAFTLVWDINTTFGIPLSATFSIPIATTATSPGSASFTPEIHWNTIENNTPHADRRLAYAPATTTFTVPTVTSFSAPAAAFQVTSLPATAGTDQFILHGILTFTADNDANPVTIEIPTDFQNQTFQFFDAGGLEVVPEPTTILLLTLMAPVAAARRRV